MQNVDQEVIEYFTNVSLSDEASLNRLMDKIRFPILRTGSNLDEKKKDEFFLLVMMSARPDVSKPHELPYMRKCHIKSQNAIYQDV